MFILEDAGLFVKAFEVFQMIEAIHPHAEISIDGKRPFRRENPRASPVTL